MMVAVVGAVITGLFGIAVVLVQVIASARTQPSPPGKTIAGVPAITGAPGPPSSTSPTTSSDPTNSSGGTAPFHTGALKLQKYGDPADLDAAQGDPRWGQGTMDTNRDGDLNWNGVALQASAAAAKVMWVSKSDDQTCVSNSGFAREPVLLSQLKQNGRLCVLTTEGRVALVVVTQASEASVSLKVTTYKKDGD